LFEISEEAKELILARLDAALEGRPELRRGTSTVGLRLNFKQGGANLSLAFPRPTDTIMSFMGRALLIIDLMDLPRLDDICLSVQQGPRGCTLSMVPRTTETPLEVAHPASLPAGKGIAPRLSSRHCE
jgi:hypothetical protein